MVDRSEPGLVAPLTRDRPTETLGAQQKAPSAQCHWRRPLDQPPPDGRCAYCNQQMNSRGVVQPTVEHVLTFRLLLERRPGQDLCLGPALDAVWNLVLSCEPCDQGEAGTTSSNVVDALARQSKQRPHRGTPPSSSDARGPAWSDTGTQPQPEPAARPWAVSATARASRAAPCGRSAPSSSCLVGDVVDHLAVRTRDRLQPVMPGVDICASAALVTGPAGDLGGERPLSRARRTRQVPSRSARGAAAVPPTRPSSAVWTSAGAQGAARPPVGHPRLDRPATTPGHGAWVTVDTDVPFTRQGEGPRAPGTWRAR